MQGHQEKRKHSDYLWESKAQTEAGLIKACCLWRDGITRHLSLCAAAVKRSDELFALISYETAGRAAFLYSHTGISGKESSKVNYLPDTHFRPEDNGAVRCRFLSRQTPHCQVAEREFTERRINPLPGTTGCAQLLREICGCGWRDTHGRFYRPWV